MQLVDQLTIDENSWGHVTRQDDVESPGAGRAKLRLSRGFGVASPRTSSPMQLVDQLTEEFMGVTSQGRMTRKAPALVGRSSV